MNHRSPPSSQQTVVATRRPRGRRLIGLALASMANLLLIACSSTPPVVRLHSLLESTASMALASDGAAAAAPLSLVIAPVGVPSAAAQPQWLVRRSDDTLQMLEQDRWAAPLTDEFRAALRAGLASRWGVVDGSLPRPAEDARHQASWRLAVEILRIDARPSADTSIDARWTLLPPRGTVPVSCSSHIVEQVSGAGTVAIADAYRRAVVRLVDQIGATLRGNAGAGGAATGCGRVVPPST